MSSNRPPRVCATCQKEKSVDSYFSAHDPVCRACKKKAMREQVKINPTQIDEMARAHRVRHVASEEEKKMARQAAKDKRQYHRKAKAAKVEVNWADREMASRVLARRRLLPFIMRFHPKYHAGWVHEDICRRLERFSDDVIAQKSPRLLLLMPPRHGKSEIASRKFPAWHLGRAPEHEVIACSHSSSLSMGFSRGIRELLRNPAYQNVFDRCKLDPESQSVEQWRTTEGGGFTAAGVGTGITGMGAHVLTIDDPVKDMEAADSPTIRDATWEWYMSTAYTRLAPGGGILGIQTWWNDDDWAGRVQQSMATGDGEKFEIVKYPAINEGYDEFLSREDSIIEVYPGMAIPAGARMTRAAGTALHPARYPTEYLQQVKKNYYSLGQGRIWSALYQQNPAPEEGAFFTKEMIRKFTHEPNRATSNVYQAWDFAISTKAQNDWTVCSTMLQDTNNDLYELNLLRFKSDNSIVIVDMILDEYEKYTPDLLGFEDGQIWKSIKAIFELRCQERRLYPSYEVLQPLTDKMVRAGPLRGRMQQGKVHYKRDAPYERDADQELLRFPAGKNDDIVDARAWCVRLTLSHSAPRIKQPPAVKSWKDKLKMLPGGGGTTHMAA